MIKNDILIQRRNAVSERINTSEAIFIFFGSSIIWVAVERVSKYWPPLLLGGRSGVTRSALMSLEEESSVRWSLLESHLEEQMRTF